MFYNGPGFLIPTLGIGGGRHSYYHFDRDDFEMVNLNQLQTSLDVLLRIVDVLETDSIPIPKYKGPVYLSRFNLYVDANLDRKAYDNLEYIQILMDGSRTCFDIAHELDIDFFFVRDFCQQLIENNLVEQVFKNSFASS